MVPTHAAWTFHPESAHRALGHAVVEKGQPSIGKLREHARTVVETDDQSSSPSYLEMVRFDPSWFGSEELEAGRLYVIAISPYLTKVQISIGGGMYGALTAFGWSQEEALELLNGEPLSTLSRIIDDPLMTLVAPDLDSLQFGGWLSQERAVGILNKLHRLQPQFRATDSPHLRSLTERTHLSLEETRQAVIGLYESATRLLQTLLELRSGTALRSITD